jgi:hypothetical protein
MSLNTDYGAEIEAQGNLEELFIHEGSHASLDGYHANVSFFIDYFSTSLSKLKYFRLLTVK